MKCNQSRPGFELVSLCPFPTMITSSPRAPHCRLQSSSDKGFVEGTTAVVLVVIGAWMYIYIYMSVCIQISPVIICLALIGLDWWSERFNLINQQVKSSPSSYDFWTIFIKFLALVASKYSTVFILKVLEGSDSRSIKVRKTRLEPLFKL